MIKRPNFVFHFIQMILTGFSIGLTCAACAVGTSDGEHAKAAALDVPSPVTSKVAAPELTQGWNAFLAGLAGARQGLENPALFESVRLDRHGEPRPRRTSAEIGDGRLATPRNDLNSAAPPVIAGGTAGARQIRLHTLSFSRVHLI